MTNMDEAEKIIEELENMFYGDEYVLDKLNELKQIIYREV